MIVNYADKNKKWCTGAISKIEKLLRFYKDSTGNMDVEINIVKTKYDIHGYIFFSNQDGFECKFTIHYTKLTTKNITPNPAINIKLHRLSLTGVNSPNSREIVIKVLDIIEKNYPGKITFDLSLTDLCIFPEFKQYVTDVEYHI
jgi:hypothetical protein